MEPTPFWRRYLFIGGSSRKFWEIKQDGCEVATRWGRIGSKPQTSTKTYPHPWEAKQAAVKLVVSKKKKGYRRSGDPEAASAKKPRKPATKAAEDAFMDRLQAKVRARPWEK